MQQPMIKQFKTPAVILFVLLLQACNGSTSKINCIGATDPINISLNNNGDLAQVVSLFSHSDKEGFIKIGQFDFDPYEVKELCLDKAGELQNGLFVFNGIDAYGLRLEGKKSVEINLTGNKYQIISPEQLSGLIKAM